MLTLCLFMNCDLFFLFQANVLRAQITYLRTAYMLPTILGHRKKPDNNDNMNKPTPELQTPPQSLPPLPPPMNHRRKMNRMQRKMWIEVEGMVYSQRRMLKSQRYTKNIRSVKKRRTGMTASCNCKVLDNS